MRQLLAVFAVCFVGLGLTAWERVLSPSPHFHFADLASSLLRGRVDTDTPRRNKSDRKRDVWAERGFYDAVERHTTNPDGSSRGWNDWASYRHLVTKKGEEFRGVYPWRDQEGARKHEFHTLAGDVYHIDCADVRTGCRGGSPRDVSYFVSFPPFPGVAMMPLVAVWGYDVNDVLFTLFFASLNGAILFWLLQSLVRRGHSERTTKENLWLVALFVFGTVHFFSSVRGEVWFTALILGVTLNLLAIACAIDARRPILAGLFVGLGMATRTPLAFSCVLIALLVLFPGGKPRTSEWGAAIGRLAAFAVPVAAVLAALMVWNYVRFEHVLEFGHRYLQEGARPAIREHGLLSGWFLGQNLSAALTNPPVFTLEGGWPIRITRHGLGLLWTTPVLFLLAGSPRRTWLFKALLITAFVVALPGLFYQNTGWEQFGYRFGLDWLPFLVVAFAIGGRKLTPTVKGLILFGIAVNTFGAITFGRVGGLYY